MGRRRLIRTLIIGEPLIELSCSGSLLQANTLTKSVGGDAFNLAVGLARLGTSVNFFTRQGKDVFAEHIRQMMWDEGIDTHLVRTVNGHTGLYLVSVMEDGHREFVYYRDGSAASTLCADDIRPTLFQGADILFSSGVTLALSDTTREALVKAYQMAKERDITTVFDPNFRRSLWSNTDEALDAMNAILPYVDIILPTVPDDTESLISIKQPDRVIEYFWLKGVKLVVVKAGPDGGYIGYKRQIERSPAIEAQAVDTTGAGDAFNAGFLYALGQQLPLLECVRVANTVAGLKIQRRGAIAGLPTKEALLKRLRTDDAAVAVD